MKVFICSPLSAETEEKVEANKERARVYCREAYLEGHNPFAPHLFYTQFLDDTNPAEREDGLKLGMEELKKSDVVWAYADCYENVSSGMRLEILCAWSYGIPVIFKFAQQETPGN